MIDRNRDFRRTLYLLKRRRGEPINITQTTGKTFDAESGEQSLVTVTCRVKRAVPLPNVADRAFYQDLSYVAHNRDFTYGGIVDKAERRFLVEDSDLYIGSEPFRPKVGDRITFKDRRWDIYQVNEFDIRIGVIIFARESGNTTLEVNEVVGGNDLTFGQAPTAEVVP